MSRNVDTFVEVSNPGEVGSNDIFYIISKPDGGTPTDKKITAGVLVGAILGTQEINTIDGNATITISSSDGKRRQAKLVTLENKLFGTEGFITPTKETIFRVAAGVEHDAERGFVTFENLVSSLVIEDVGVSSILDASITDVRLTIDGVNSKISLELFDGYLLGKDIVSNISRTDTMFIAGNNTRSKITFGTITDKLFPITVFFGTDDVKNDMKFVVSNADASKRGTLALDVLKDFIVGELALPDYVTSDNVTSNVTFLYRDTNDHGYISPAGMKQIILNSESRTIIGTTALRSTDGTAGDGLISLNTIKENFLESVHSIYGIDPAHKESDINNGDGFIFVSTGDTGAPPTYKNISYLTIRDKILGIGNNLSVVPSTKILVDGGYVTYEQLKTRLHLDFYGN